MERVSLGVLRPLARVSDAARTRLAVHPAEAGEPEQSRRYVKLTRIEAVGSLPLGRARVRERLST
jgi:hypothetical protein